MIPSSEKSIVVDLQPLYSIPFQFLLNCNCHGFEFSVVVELQNRLTGYPSRYSIENSVQIFFNTFSSLNQIKLDYIIVSKICVKAILQEATLRLMISGYCVVPPPAAFLQEMLMHYSNTHGYILQMTPHILHHIVLSCNSRSYHSSGNLLGILQISLISVEILMISFYHNQ